MYCREVKLDGESFEELIDVKHLRPLTPAEWFMELFENDKHKWDDQHIGNVLRNLPDKIDVTRPPKYRGIPLRPYPVKGAEQLSLFNMPTELADQV